jgi:hypothetical protein
VAFWELYPSLFAVLLLPGVSTFSDE